MKKHNVATLIDSQPCTSSGLALVAFLSARQKTTSSKNVTHLYESLWPLCHKFPCVETITYPDLHHWSEELTIRYSIGSVRSKLVDIRTFFKWCKENGHVTVNVAKNLKLPRARPRNKAANETHYHTVVSSLAEQLKQHVFKDVSGRLAVSPGVCWQLRSHLHTVRDLFLLVFLYETGCRAGEAAKLSSRAMDEAIQHSVTVGSNEVFTLAVVGKTGVRYRSFTRATSDLWRIWSSVRPGGNREYALVKWREVGEHPRPLTSEDVTKIVVRRCQIAGVPIFRPHALRHAKAQRAKRVGGVQVAAALLDHDDLTSTLFYTAEDEHTVNAAAVATGLQVDLW